MKTIKWSSIRDVAGWRTTLQDLLDQARLASGAEDDAELLQVVAALNSYVDRSFPNTPEIRALDEVALDAVESMTEQIAAGAVARIAARTMRLSGLAKRIQEVADQVEQDAAVVRLEKAHAAVDAVVDASRAIQGLDQALGSGDADLKDRIKAILKELDRFGSLVGKAAKKPTG